VNMFSLTNGAIGRPTVTDMAHFKLPRSIAVEAIWRNYLIFKVAWAVGSISLQFPADGITIAIP
jgi:hypothetical protein